MYCTACGRPHDDAAAYCSFCGKKVKPQTRGRRWLKITAGSAMTVLAVAALGLASVYALTYQRVQAAVSAATAGNFTQANMESQKTIWIGDNNQFRVLASLFSLGADAQRDLANADTLVKDSRYRDAIALYEKDISALEQQGYHPFKPLIASLQTAETSANVRLIEQNAMSSEDVPTVAGALWMLTTYHTAESQTAQATVRERLVSLVKKTVNGDLQKNDFNAAAQVVATALSSDAGNQDLAALSDQIKQARTAYEVKQQQIAEQTLVHEADKANSDANPLTLKDFQVSTDNQGDLTVQGTVENRGTQTVGTITVVIEFMDKTGAVVDTEYASVTPDPIASGGSAAFSSSCPYFLHPDSAKVTNYTFFNE